MANIFNDLRAKFRNGDLLTQIIFVNIGIFVAVRLTAVILQLFNIPEETFMSYIQVPAYYPDLIRRPWTLITYMFLHYDIWHILFNMLWLFGFGKIFLHFFPERQLGGVYLLGGLAGALFYLLAYNLFPLFEKTVLSSSMMGASAAVIAIVVAAAFHVPDYKVNLLFFGPVSLKYIAAITIVIDALSITSDNAGGHIAHLGGALMGYLFATAWTQGKDLTAWVNRAIDEVVTLFKPGKRKLKVKVKKGGRPESDIEYRQRKKNETQEIDQILDKIKKSGYSQLSADEKRKLFDAGNKS